MKVLQVITKSNFGGAQRYVFDVATNLDSRDYEVVVALGGEGILKTKLDEAGIRTISINKLKRDISVVGDSQSFFALCSIIRKERPDVLHLHSSKAGGLGALAGRIFGVPNIIFTSHGWAFNEKRSFISKIVIRFLAWLTIMLSHTTVVVSDKTKRDAEIMPFVGSRLVRVYNGITAPIFLDRRRARSELAALTPALEAHTESTWIGTISELHSNKGLEYSIEAIRDVAITHPSIIFVIIGEGELRAAIEALIVKYQLEQRVFLTGFVQNAKEYLKAFDIFTLTSVTEGLPYAVIEAGLAQIPVIASNVGGIPEIVDQLHSGILTRPQDARDVASALNLLLNDSAKAARFAHELYARVTIRFSIQQMIDGLKNIYASHR